MDYILYNQDGSIRLTNFTEFINKGSNKVNKIFIGLSIDENFNLSNYNSYAVFKLPNDELAGPLIGESANLEVDGVTWHGFKIELTQDVTAFAGLVKCSIKVAKNDKVLYTYPVVLTINDTSVSPEDLTQANLSQYNNLKYYLDGKLDEKIPWINNDETFTIKQAYNMFGNRIFGARGQFYDRVLCTISYSGENNYYVSLCTTRGSFHGGTHTGETHLTSIGLIKYSKIYKHKITITGVSVAEPIIFFFNSSEPIEKLSDLFGNYSSKKEYKIGNAMYIYGHKEEGTYPKLTYYFVVTSATKTKQYKITGDPSSVDVVDTVTEL